MTDRKGAAMFGPPLHVQRRVLQELGLPVDLTGMPDPDAGRDCGCGVDWYSGEEVAAAINEVCARARRLRAEEGSPNENNSDDR